MRAKFLCALLCLAVLPALGLLVERCADCHAVPGYSTSTPATGLPAPAFKVMANDPEILSLSRRTFARFLAKAAFAHERPHPVTVGH